jgi:hypothetical protein
VQNAEFKMQDSAFCTFQSALKGAAFPTTDCKSVVAK